MISDIITTATRIALGTENCLYVNDLSAVMNNTNTVDITVREFIKMVFAELGIEVEFSGRNEYEKGVIIDVDEDKIIQLGLCTDALKFGQIIVRVGGATSKSTAISQQSDVVILAGEELNWNSAFGWDEFIKKSLKTKNW